MNTRKKHTNSYLFSDIQCAQPELCTQLVCLLDGERGVLAAFHLGGIVIGRHLAAFVCGACTWRTEEDSGRK